MKYRWRKQKDQWNSKLVFEKINKVDKPLLRFIKKKWEKAQIIKVGNEKRDALSDTMDIKKIT